MTSIMSEQDPNLVPLADSWWENEWGYPLKEEDETERIESRGRSRGRSLSVASKYARYGERKSLRSRMRTESESSKSLIRPSDEFWKFPTKTFHKFMCLPVDIRRMVYDCEVLMEVEPHLSLEYDACKENNWSEDWDRLQFLVFFWDDGPQPWPSTFLRIIPSRLGWKRCKSEHLALLNVSRDVREEVMDVLATNFCFESPTIKFREGQYILNHTYGLAERVQHICIDIQDYIKDMGDTAEDWESYKASLPAKRPRFTDAEFRYYSTVLPSLRSTTLREYEHTRPVWTSIFNYDAWQIAIDHGALWSFNGFADMKGYLFGDPQLSELRDGLMLCRDVLVEEGVYSLSAAWSALEELDWPVIP